MVRLVDVAEPLRSVLSKMECPRFESTPWASGPPLSERRVAIVSSAALLRRGDRGYEFGDTSHRTIDRADRHDIVMGHTSTNFDRSGYEQDLNVVFPLDRLDELATEGVVGSVADRHYSFLGAADPKTLGPTGQDLARRLKDDGVDAVLFVPV